MSDDKSKEEIEAANEQADYHLNEMIEGMIAGVDELRDSLRQEIRRRLVDAFYNGVDWQIETCDNKE